MPSISCSHEARPAAANDLPTDTERRGTLTSSTAINDTFYSRAILNLMGPAQGATLTPWPGGRLVRSRWQRRSRGNASRAMSAMSLCEQHFDGEPVIDALTAPAREGGVGCDVDTPVTMLKRQSRQSNGLVRADGFVRSGITLSSTRPFGCTNRNAPSSSTCTTAPPS